MTTMKEKKKCSNRVWKMKNESENYMLGEKELAVLRFHIANFSSVHSLVNHSGSLVMRQSCQIKPTAFPELQVAFLEGPPFVFQAEKISPSGFFLSTTV